MRRRRSQITAASALIAGRFTSGNGQICCAVKRVLVENSQFDRLSEALLAKTQSLRLGDPASDDTDVGPLISEAAARRVEAQVNRAVADGAKVLTGGTRRGAFYDPTILTDVPRGSSVHDEEIFGPVLPLYRFGDFEEALAIANDTAYGLQAAIFTSDMGRGDARLPASRCRHRHRQPHDGDRVETLPFGGNKLSGNGARGYPRYAAST